MSRFDVPKGATPEANIPNVSEVSQTEEVGSNHIAPERSENATEFFERHGKFFTSYAQASGLEVREAPPEAKTFSIDLESGVMYGAPKFFEKGTKRPDAVIVNYFLHEIEHLREIVRILEEPEGAEIWKAHKERLKKSGRLHFFDNIIDDIGRDRSIIERAPSHREIQRQIYETGLYPSTDVTSKPRHIQFVYALFRETMLPDQPCKVSDVVRREIDELRAMRTKDGTDIIDFLSDPNLPPSLRIKLQMKFLEPVFEKLFWMDVDEKRKKQKEEENDPRKLLNKHHEGKKEPTGWDVPKPKKPKKKLPLGQEDPEAFFEDEYANYWKKNPDKALERFCFL